MMPPSEAPSRNAATDAATALSDVVQRGSFDQKDGERGVRCIRVNYLGVQNLLPEGEPGA